MSYDLTKKKATIQGRFWFPDDTNKVYEGHIEFDSGKKATLNLRSYETNALAEMSSKIVDSKSRKPLFRNRKIIHGKNDQGESITLYHCYANPSGSLQVANVQYQCEALFEGVSLSYDDLDFDGVDMHFDFQEAWVSKTAFTTYNETSNDGKELKKVTIPFCEKNSINLLISAYKSSEIYCGYNFRRFHDSLIFQHRSSINLSFETAYSYRKISNLIQQWEWFLSLLTRKTVKIKTLDMKKNGYHFQGSKKTLKPIEVWLGRTMNNLPRREPNKNDFYCTFDDIENDFSKIFNRWLKIQDSWAPVLHRFFATTQPRDIWTNEEFLFLAQAIESIHRIKADVTGIVDFNKAAKEIYLATPAELQGDIGHRKTFQKQLHLSRNYYTHYGKPSPAKCEHILERTDLADLNEKLRWIIECSIMQEIGIPENITSKVWSTKWKSHWVKFED